MRVVISQSMLFPWVGLLEQMKLADQFVHYDDVQFSKGSFVNRVQIKTAQGVRWLTVPLHDLHLGQRIDEVAVAAPERWRDKHMEMLAASFQGAPFARDALALAAEVYATAADSIGRLSRRSMLALAGYFGLDVAKRCVDVRELAVPGDGSDRVLQIVRKLGGTDYITGHGAARYLQHEQFAASGIDVSYMDYACVPYPQLHGEFTPYVSSLDLIANCGAEGIRNLCSGTLSWREFVNESHRTV